MNARKETFLDTCEYFLEHHKLCFDLLLFSIVFVPVPFYFASIVHTCKGNGQKFPIAMSVSIISVYVFYGAYCWAYSLEHGYDAWGDTFYFLSIGLFSFVHWLISYTYFECAYINPYKAYTI